MAQKILIAFDDSENAMRAVEFAAQTFKEDSRVTLFHVLQDTAAMCEIYSPELTEYFAAQRSSFCALEAKKRQIVEDAMKVAKTKLVSAGFSTDKIKTKIEVKKSGIARDIVLESQTGYDAIVMGRRGLSGIKEFFLGSISQKVFHSTKLSVIIVN